MQCSAGECSKKLTGKFCGTLPTEAGSSIQGERGEARCVNGYVPKAHPRLNTKGGLLWWWGAGVRVGFDEVVEGR
jgi:hypothetical protein